MLIRDRHSSDILHCTDPDCAGGLEVFSITEGDTGQTYYTDSSVDKIDKGCPICGKPLKEA